MIKKYIISGLTVAVLMVQSGGVAFAVLRNASPVFSDMVNDYAQEYYDALVYLKAQGIVSGYADGSFKPYEKINRAEFTKIIVGASRTEPDNGLCMETFANQDGSYANMFNDVISTKNPWYLDFVCYAKVEHLIDGYADGSFKPGQNINFVEAAKILSNAFQLTAQSSPGGPWYQGYVEALASKKNIPTTIFHFDQEITRGEMAEMVYRLKTHNTSLPSLTYETLAPAPLYSNTRYGFALNVSSNCKDHFKIQEAAPEEAGREEAKFLVLVPSSKQWTQGEPWYEYMVWSSARYSRLKDEDAYGMIELLTLKNNMLLIEGTPQDLPTDIDNCRIFETVL